MFRFSLSLTELLAYIYHSFERSMIHYTKRFFLFIFTVFIATVSFSQNSPCDGVSPFCSDQSLTFPNTTDGGNGPTNINYNGCNVLDGGFNSVQAPNPVWYYFQVDQPGTLELTINQQAANGQGLDTDFMMWGPFSSVGDGCQQINGGLQTIECGISADPYEEITLGIPGGSDNSGFGTQHGIFTPPAGQTGEYYIVMITNFVNSAGTITFEQTGGTGTANCDIVTNPDECAISGLTATAVCNGNNTTISGSFTINSNYTSGTVTVSSPCGSSQTFQPADWAASPATLNYSIDGGQGDGTNCTVKVEFSGDPGCVATTNVTKPNCNPCNITLNPSNASLCVGEDILITASTAGGTWTSSNNAVATVSNGTVTAISQGTVVITYATATCQVTATLQVSTSVDPTFTNPGPICTGQSFTLPTTSIEGVAGTWSPAFDNTQTTTYTFTPSAAFPCSSTFTMEVEVGNSIAPTFTNPGPICSNETFSLPNTSNNGILGVWSPAPNNSQTTSYVFTPVNATGCATNATMTVVVNTINSTSDVTSSAETVQEGNTTQLNVTLSPYIPGILYAWNPSSTLSCADCPSPISTPTAPTWYYVTMTTPEGCKYKDSVFVNFKMNCGDVYVPTIFSPNDDGANDAFKPYSRCLKTGEMYIYNRWGEKVFFTTDLDKGWDGTQREKMLNSGVYHYRIITNSLYGETLELKGSVTLVR